MLSGRRALYLTSCGAGLAALIAGSGASAETLADAIALAYQTNPTLQAQRASQRGLDETYVQARTGYRPTVGATRSGTTSDTSPATTFSAPDQVHASSW